MFFNCTPIAVVALAGVTPLVRVILFETVSLEISNLLLPLILQRSEPLQPRSVLQTSTIDHQSRRRSWKQPRGSRGLAGQSESCSQTAILPAITHQSLWAVLSDWFGLQVPAGCHHLCEPSAAQVRWKLMLENIFAHFHSEKQSHSCLRVPEYYSQTAFLHVVVCFCMLGYLIKVESVFIWNECCCCSERGICLLKPLVNQDKTFVAVKRWQTAFCHHKLGVSHDSRVN